MKKNLLLASVLLAGSLTGMPVAVSAQTVSPTATQDVYDFSGIQPKAVLDLFYDALQQGRNYPTEQEFATTLGILPSDIAFLRSHVRKAEIMSREDRLIQDTYEKRNLWCNLPMSVGKDAKVGHPSTHFADDVFSMWQYTNLWGAWNQPFFRAPGSWVDAAHKNGTDIMSGIMFFESWTAGSGDSEWTAVLAAKNTDGTFKYVKPMINCLMYFGTDGINYNWEDSSWSDEDVVAFNKALYKEAATQGFNNFHMGLYTSVSGLTASNSASLFGDADGQVADLMLNYSNGDFSYQISSSATTAKAAVGSTERLYAGVWIVSLNRRWTALNTGDAKECGICLWGEHDQSRFWSYNAGGDAYEAQDNYQKLLEHAFSGGNSNPLDRPAVSTTGIEWEGTNPLSTFAGLATWIPERSAIQGNLPFASYFNLGNGDRYNYKGKKTAGSWYNMANQDRVPTYRWLVTTPGTLNVSTEITPSFTHNDAYTGGSCLKLAGTSSATGCDITLFKTKLTAQSAPYVKIAVKNGLAGENASDLYVILKKADGTIVETPVGTVTGNTWQEKKINVAGIAQGDVIASIGLRVKGSNSNYNMLVGKLEVNDDATVAPASIADAIVEVKEETKTSLSIKANWKADKVGTDRAAWGLTYNDEANIDHFEILYKNGEEGKISEIARTTQWAAYVGDIQFESVNDKPFIGIRAVSTDLKSYSPIEWIAVARADQGELPDASVEDTFGKSQIDPNSAGLDIACATRYLTKIQTTGATTNIDYTADGPQADGTQYVRVPASNTLVVEQGQTVNLTFWAYDSSDGLKWCFAGGWMDLDASGTFNPDNVTDNPAAGERLFFAGTLRAGTDAFQSAAGYTSTFTIPTDAATGKSRLRIVFSDAWFAGQFLPTGLTAKGFSIDFDVVIQGSNASRPKPADNHDQGIADEPEGLEHSGVATLNSEVSTFFKANDNLTFKNVEKAWIYDATGRMMNYLANPTTFDVSGYANGVYIVRMQNGKVIRSGKFGK